ncbi:mechanosensitive ion channel family protein [uncultured Croceicoccus sp.]|uniref:mechanosensitive ion channel family protein n=1 Tax=uncultured Croceicoccus sp. TaxID=1295329 RepID=UPI00260799D6|nr:mechanosensitive ion channel family protein [uncultured Croceicoccus sp.]
MSMILRPVFLLFSILCLLAMPHMAQAQLLPATGGDEEAAEQAPDPYGRETPRDAVTELIRALAGQDYAQASHYFDFENADTTAGESDAQVLAATLQASLDAGGKLRSFSELSSDAAGRVDDGLPPDRERIGTLGDADNTPIILMRSESADGAMVWRIAPETVDALEGQSRDLQLTDSNIDEIEGGWAIAGAPIGDWLMVIGVFLGLFIAFRLVAAAILWLLRAALSDPPTNGLYRFLDAALPPFALLLAVIVFQLWGGGASISIIARQTALRYIGIAAWVALAWFALRLIDTVARTLTHRMEKAERRQAVSVVTLARRAAKIILLGIATVAILDTLGIDVTTGIAALGIGGLALALGAQKTIENLVGSVMVIADRPVQVGDFCRVGDVTGTVEDIGMRSTRIRTLDRTLVTIPNGDFSSLQIENYAARDQFLFHPTIGLEYALTPEQLRDGIRIIESVLQENEHVAIDWRARLKNFGASSLDIEVFAYIEVSDYAESLAIRQALLLDIYDRLHAANIGVAFPTQTLYLRRDAEGAEGDGDAAEG